MAGCRTGHWKTTTFVAGLRRDGITAPFVIDRPMNGVIFRTYVERVLAPTLRPGDVVARPPDVLRGRTDMANV